MALDCEFVMPKLPEPQQAIEPLVKTAQVFESLADTFSKLIEYGALKVTKVGRSAGELLPDPITPDEPLPQHFMA